MTRDQTDAAALERFLRGVERRALRHVELAGQSREDALDILQEAMLAFVRAYRNKPEEAWPLLFWKVLGSKLVDAQRRGKLWSRWFGWLGRNGAEDEDDPVARFPDRIEAGPEQRLGDQEAALALEAALRELPQRQRQAFLLRVWEGLDVTSTARAMGVSEGSVKTHLFRAMQQLRARLGEYL